MNRINYFQTLALCCSLCFVTMGCNAPKDEKAVDASITTGTDLVKLKADVQALEAAWSAADNARDTATLIAFYADDAVSLSDNKPMAVGKEAILATLKEGLKSRKEGHTVAYEVMDVYGDENTVTEVGTTTGKDATGKVTYKGKYMAVWEKRDGKYLCVREIYNDDEKEK